MEKIKQSQNDKIIIRDEIRENPFFLIKEILGYKDVVELHQELITFTVSNKKEILILIPRGHFKTSVITIGISIWLILHNRNVRININNKILGNAKKFLGEIKEHFENNQELINIYGDLKGAPWGMDQIRVAGRTKILKDPTIQIGAIGHEATSAHFDFLFNDDLVGLKDMASEAERENTLNFYRTMEYLKDKKTNARIINIGTRWHLDDLHSHVINKLPADCVMRKQAEIDNNTKPLFPELYTMDELNEMRKDDLIMYSAQMMNEPIPTETQLFKYDELKFFDIDDISISSLKLANYTDFAMSKTSQADYTANLSLAYNETDIWVIAGYVERLTPANNIIKINDAVNEAYDIGEIGAEANKEELFVDELEKAIKKKVRKIKHSTDKILRINAIHSIVRREVHFRRDWESAYPRLIEQLIRFPEAKYDDGPDALEGGISMIRKKNALQGPVETEDQDLSRLSPVEAYKKQREAKQKKKREEKK